MGLGFYMMHSTLQTQATELAPEARGTAVSLFAFSLFIGQGIGAAVFGRIVDNFGYIYCFIVAGVAWSSRSKTATKAKDCSSLLYETLREGCRADIVVQIDEKRCKIMNSNIKNYKNKYQCPAFLLTKRKLV